MQRVLKYLQEGLWNVSLKTLEPAARKRIYGLRVAVLSVRNFFKDNCILWASTLTYYTMMSIVPLAAMSFAIARGFGFGDDLQRQIYRSFPEQKAALDAIFEFANNLLGGAQNGVLAGVGVLLLLLSVTLLLSSMEESMNQIWGARHLRSWKRIATDYLFLMFLAPLFLVISGSFTLLAESLLPRVAGPVAGMFSLVVAWLYFTFLYLFMPNVRVKLGPGAIGGIFGATLFLGAQQVYLHFQVFILRLGAIYGSFAALPLFLVWVQISWFLFLLGAELCHSIQRVHEQEFAPAVGKMQPRDKLAVALYIAHLIYRGHATGETHFTLLRLVEEQGIPFQLAREELQRLVRANLLVHSGTYYFPAREGASFRLSDALEALGGTADLLPLEGAPELGALRGAVNAFIQSLATHPQNLFVTTLNQSH